MEGTGTQAERVRTAGRVIAVERNGDDAAVEEGGIVKIRIRGEDIGKGGGIVADSVAATIDWIKTMMEEEVDIGAIVRAAQIC